MQTLGRACRLPYFKMGLQYILENFKGEIIPDSHSLYAIPGVGPYSVAAIRLFGFGIRDTIIDSNVVRVISRINGIDYSAETRRKKEFIQLAEKSVPESEFVEYSYGVLDFAADICKPRKPHCTKCMFAYFCCYVKCSSE